MTLKRKRSRAPLVIRDNLFDGSRQVKVQPQDCDMYDSARWVVACLGVGLKPPWVCYMPHFCGSNSERYRRVVFPLPTPAEFSAFVRGDMPAAVFADWLEERGADLGDDAYAILRGWAANGNG